MMMIMTALTCMRAGGMGGGPFGGVLGGREKGSTTDHNYVVLYKGSQEGMTAKVMVTQSICTNR
jgi:hypothetical protein